MRGRPSALPEPWRTVAKQHGGVLRFCRHLGVPHSTLWRWAHGHVIPTDPALVAKLEEALRCVVTPTA